MQERIIEIIVNLLSEMQQERKHKGPVTASVNQILQGAKSRRGYALPRSHDSQNALADIDALLQETNLHLVVTDSDQSRIDAMRERFRDQRDRVCLLLQKGKPLQALSSSLQSASSSRRWGTGSSLASRLTRTTTGRSWTSTRRIRRIPGGRQISPITTPTG